jgi:hypothetical protein
VPSFIPSFRRIFEGMTTCPFDVATVSIKYSFLTHVKSIPYFKK